jgi:integrase
MPRGSAVIRYAGKRGIVWRIKYVDAAGRQVQETLGREVEGWTERKANAELRERLVRVERRGYRRPKPLTFTSYAETWFEEAKRRRAWSARTVAVYRPRLDRLEETFGVQVLADARPRHVAAYVAAMSKLYAPATVNGDISLGHDIYKSAMREELVDSNPFDGAERPKIPKRHWRILQPVEVAKVAASFTDTQARAVFLTLVLTGLRRSELQALRWGDVELANPDGPLLRVRDAKTEEGVRSIAVPSRLADELFAHRRRSRFQGEGEYVFCHPERGSRYLAKTWRKAFAAALAKAGVEGRVRPFHDLRHTAITNDAAAGANPTALMAKAGHADMRTTKVYLHLAGIVFREEAEALERRLLGGNLVPDFVPISADLSDSEGTETA